MIVHYVSGSRADFGLMELTLKRINASKNVDLGVIVTGQHLLTNYGATENEIVKSDLSIVARIKVELSGASGAEMALALADQLRGYVEFWSKNRPNLVLVLGDRGEMLAAAIAAVHLGIHVAHLHGGELSGTLDESIRHAISKLSHFHLVSSTDSANRLQRMGEKRERIMTVGAPGLVGIKNQAESDIDLFSNQYGLATSGPKVLVCFHPVVQEADRSSVQIGTILQAIKELDCCGVILRPNSDAGGIGIDSQLDKFVDKTDAGRFAIVDHLSRPLYLQTLAQSDILVGNSSSGIIESASLDVPFLNIGTRQNKRLKNNNIVDCKKIDTAELKRTFRLAIELKGPFNNKYGDGLTDVRLANLLTKLPLERDILQKENSY